MSKSWQVSILLNIYVAKVNNYLYDKMQLVNLTSCQKIFRQFVNIYVTKSNFLHLTGFDLHLFT